MWTQRDQIQAYQFLRRRLVSALVAADANHPVSPSRRLVLGTVLGVAVMLLVTAVFGVIGLLKPSGGKDWLAGGHVIVEEGTGARYILGQDNALHPVLNYASARLLAGGNGDATVSVSAKNLATAPRGGGVGIAGAPDSLPGAGNLVTSRWNSCSKTTPDAPSSAEPTSVVVLGAAATGREVGSAEGLLVRLAGGERYLIAGGQRYKLSADASAALGYDAGSAVVVSGRWLNTVPAGRDLSFIAVADAGRAGPKVGTTATKVGQILVVNDAVTGTPAGYYLVRKDGLQVVTQTEAALIMAAPANSDAYEKPGTTVVKAAEVAKTGRVTAENAGGYPGRIPALLTVTGGVVTVCAEGDGAGPARIVLSGAPPGGRAIAAPKTDARAADEVFVPPSGGAVVTELMGSGTVYLVTDTGLKYPVASAQALAALGYGAVRKQAVSSGLLGLVPTGPALDPAAAAQLVAPVAGAG
ncbi:type VII secretion protein EccB [Amycolatopsis sp. NPDC059657]|uniref:type VII secretion protein EccB n=1 Tax=Amycolatopsis sp. NPDC059657 TaxID=3346899 RepID=UPI00366C7175